MTQSSLNTWLRKRLNKQKTKAPTITVCGREKNQERVIRAQKSPKVDLVPNLARAGLYVYLQQLPVSEFGDLVSVCTQLHLHDAAQMSRFLSLKMNYLSFCCSITENLGAKREGRS